MPSSVEAPLTRGHKKRERTRKRLIEAALDVIAERGEAFSVSDVASRAEMANGTFYNYFNDRDELIEALVPEVLGAFAESFAAAVVEEDPARRFATITALALTSAAAAPDQFRVLLRLDAVQHAILADGSFGHLRADLTLGVTAGRFTVASADAAVDVVVGTLLMAIRRLIAGTADADHVQQVITHLLGALGVSAGEAATIAAEAVVAAAELHQTI